MADDPELDFDGLFADSPKINQKSPTACLACDSSLTPMSPKLPKAPNPSTTVTPVLALKVVKLPWDYSADLKEAFPSAEFAGCDYPEDMTLREWPRLKQFESTSPRENAQKLDFGRYPPPDDHKADDADPVGTKDDESKEKTKGEGEGKGKEK